MVGVQNWQHRPKSELNHSSGDIVFLLNMEV